MPRPEGWLPRRKPDCRLEASKRCITVRSNLRLAYPSFLSFARIFAISKASYGWIARLPPKRVSGKAWAVLRTGQRCLLRANCHLRSIFFGGTSHLDVVSAGNLLRVLATLRSRATVEWHRRANTPLQALRGWLAQAGWTEAAPWIWHGPTQECQLDLTGRALGNSCCTPYVKAGGCRSGNSFASIEGMK